MSVRKRASRAADPDSIDYDDDEPSPAKPRGTPISPLSTLIALAVAVALYLAVAAVTIRSVYTFPMPVDLSAPEELFSEARAKVVVDKLSGELGVREVGTYGHKAAIYYLFEVLEAVAENAFQDRPDLEVEVEYQVANGTFAYHSGFLKHRFSTSYTNVENVMLRISPANKTGIATRGVLVNSHVDSAFSSPGASDDAMCVGVMVETIRVLLTQEALKAPVVFLFNGAEETFHQGAHAFMSQHEWSKGLGAVINLESTGAGGLDLFFQAAGGWASAAYARAAARPHASAIGSDVFSSGIITLDTDFRFFTRDFGSMQGVDLATVLDGYAYHTNRDTPERMQPGAMQAMGENVVALVPEFAAEMLRQEEEGEGEEGADDDAAAEDGDDDDGAPKKARDQAQYIIFDVLGVLAVQYGGSAVPALHVAVPMVAACVALVLAALPLHEVARAVVAASMANTGAFVAAAAVSWGQVLASQKPLLFYANPWMVYATTMPAATGALLWAHVRHDRGCTARGLGPSQSAVAGAVGSSLSCALLAAAMFGLGLKTAYMPAMWSVASSSFAAWEALVSASGEGSKRRPQGGWAGPEGRVARAALATAAPALVNTKMLAMLLQFACEKVGMFGEAAPLLGSATQDVVVSAVSVLVLLLAAGGAGAMAPALARCGTGGLLPAGLLISALAMSGTWSTTLGAHTAERPKRVYVQHTHVTTLDPEVGLQRIQYSYWSWGSLDGLHPLPAINATVPRVKRATAVKNADATSLRAGNTHQFQAVYPANQMMGPSVTLAKAPPPDEDHPTPNLWVTEREDLPNSSRRTFCVIDTGFPALSIINITGPLSRWSFGSPPEFIPLAEYGAHKGEDHYYLARHVGGYGGNVWGFWLDTDGPGELRVELQVTFTKPTKQLTETLDLLPEWTAPLAWTSYYSIWQL